MASTQFGGSTESRNKNKQDKTKATTGNTRVQPAGPKPKSRTFSATSTSEKPQNFNTRTGTASMNAKAKPTTNVNAGGMAPAQARTEGGISAPKANKNVAGTYRNGSAAPAAPTPAAPRGGSIVGPATPKSKYTLLPKKVAGK